MSTLYLLKYAESEIETSFGFLVWFRTNYVSYQNSVS